MGEIDDQLDINRLGFGALSIAVTIIGTCAENGAGVACNGSPTGSLHCGSPSLTVLCLSWAYHYIHQPLRDEHFGLNSNIQGLYILVGVYQRLYTWVT